MSGLCGWVGEAPLATLDAMLGAIPYRGDRTDTASGPGFAMGYRWWGDRPGKAPGIYRQDTQVVVVAGTFAPAVPDPAAALVERLANGLADLDGAFAGAHWDGENRRLTLVRDPFGVRSLYYALHGGVFYFATELKQLLAIPDFPVELDEAAIHKYLTFSFVPGEAVPIRGVKRLLPGHQLVFDGNHVTTTPYFQVAEEIDATLADPKTAVRLIRSLGREAVSRRLNGESEVGVYLSGGLDSSAVALWLKETGVAVRAFSLDFGQASVEREQAAWVARHLGIEHHLVAVDGADLAPLLEDLVWKLDLPFGDAVTGPQYLLGRAARAAGLSTVFNGEGGDQLFGGWTAKPMLAAALFPSYGDDESPEAQYLRSYHRFYGLEEELYTRSFAEQIGGPGQRRALLAPYLKENDASSFMGNVRRADIALKGSQNILPRAERMANAWALDVRVPLFDRKLAQASFRLPPQHKLHGTVEKWVLKRAVANALPAEVVWRQKFGMSVPITDWTLGPLAPLLGELLGAAALKRRGFFQTGYVERLLAGQGEPHETRRRRVGERIWALAMLELWLRIFVDGRGRQPGGSR